MGNPFSKSSKPSTEEKLLASHKSMPQPVARKRSSCECYCSGNTQRTSYSHPTRGSTSSSRTSSSNGIEKSNADCDQNYPFLSETDSHRKLALINIISSHRLSEEQKQDALKAMDQEVYSKYCEWRKNSGLTEEEKFLQNLPESLRVYAKNLLAKDMIDALKEMLKSEDQAILDYVNDYLQKKPPSLNGNHPQTEETAHVALADNKCDSDSSRGRSEMSNHSAPDVSNILPHKEQEQKSDNKILENVSEDNCKTIVLFGETGTGKSSLLNSFTNFAIFSSFDEAKKNGPVVLIETKFTYVDEYNHSREVHIKPTVFEKRPDNTESFSEKGQSVTQFATSYLFSYSNGEKQHYLRIVDTPGINDTRGEEQDRLNVRNVLNYIARFEKIEAILIVVPSNVKRFTPAFRYNLETLMNQLHRSVARNIVFGFTHSNLTQFNPGDTYNLLEEFFKDVKDISISQDNSFMFDNECYRYLCQKTRGYKCSENFHMQASISWLKSISEFQRLLKHIFTLELHKIANTFDVSFVKTIIQSMSRPIVEAMICLILNYESLSDEQKKICSYPTQYIREKFVIHCVPSTVAEGKQGISTSDKHRTGNLWKLQACYATFHTNLIEEVKSEMHLSDDIAHPKFIKCESSDGAVQTLLYDISCEKVKIHVASPSEDKILAQEAYTKQTSIKNEYRELMLIICRFIIFSKRNSLTDFSDCFKACLKMVYEQEEIYVNEGGNRTRLSIVERIRRDYQNFFNEQYELLRNRKISIEKISEDIEALKRLRETGSFLSEVIEFESGLLRKPSEPMTEPEIHCLPHMFPIVPK